MVPGRIKKIIQNDFSQPSWELDMARKDARLMMEEAKKAGTNLTVIPSIAGLMDEYISKGHGKEDWMIISRGAAAN